jgi:hypothetical protein
MKVISASAEGKTGKGTTFVKLGVRVALAVVAWATVLTSAQARTTSLPSVPHELPPRGCFYLLEPKTAPIMVPKEFERDWLSLAMSAFSSDVAIAESLHGSREFPSARDFRMSSSEVWKQDATATLQPADSLGIALAGAPTRWVLACGQIQWGRQNHE